MAVKKIELLSETNAYEAWDSSNGGYGEAPQGSAFELTRVYRVVNSDGPDQFFKHVIQLDSYGNVGGNYSSASESIPKVFTEVKPVEKTVTVFV